MAKTWSVTWVVFAAALMGVLVVVSVVDVQGKEAPVGSGTITVGNGFYNVSVQDAPSSTGIGTYTVSTGPDFPQPNENVLYGGAGGSPWTTYLTVRSFTSSMDYVTTTTENLSSNFTVQNLDPALVSLTATNTSVTVTWNTTTAPNMSDALLITQVTAVEDQEYSVPVVRVTTSVTNVGEATVSIGIRYEWDLMIDGSDDAWFAERYPDSAWTETEIAYAPPDFDHFEATNDPSFPVFSIFGTVNGPEGFSPLPTSPHRLVYADWSGAFNNAFEYTPGPSTGMDSAVLYYWGHNDTTALLLEPGATASVTQYLYVDETTGECIEEVGYFEEL